jgi:hypothetical protein
MSMFTLTALALVATGLARAYAGRSRQRREIRCRHTDDPGAAEERRSATGYAAPRRSPVRHHLRHGRRATCR